MPSPIASLYSTIDSLKRVLGDAVSNPVEFAKAAGATAAEQPATLDDMLNIVTSGLAPAGMIVPAAAKLGFTGFNKASKAMQSAEATGLQDAQSLYDQLDVYNAPQDNVLRSVISDAPAMLRPNVLSNKPNLLPDVLDHPDLYNAIPALRTTTISTRSASGKPLGTNGASFAQDNGVGVSHIGIGPHTSQDELLRSVLHEVQHNVQFLGGMSGGGSPAQFISDPDRWKEAVTHAAGARELAAMTGDIKRAAELEKDYHTLTGVQSRALTRYLGIPGEAESRLTEYMHASKQYDKFPLAIQAKQPSLVGNTTDLNAIDKEADIALLYDKYAPRTRAAP